MTQNPGTTIEQLLLIRVCRDDGGSHAHKPDVLREGLSRGRFHG